MNLIVYSMSKAELDAVSVERSQVHITPATVTRQPYVGQLPGNYNIVLLKRVIEGHHVWRGGYHLNNMLFFSDALAAAITDGKRVRLDFHHLQER